MMIRNWAHSVTFSSGLLLKPHTVAQLQDVVAHESLLHALGTGHSFSRVADGAGVLVTVAGLDIATEIDEAAGTVTVPAGARYGEVAVALEARGLALPNLGSLPHISVAGACATGTHGSGDRNQCLAASVVGVEFVSADGSLVHVRRGDPDFAGSVLALGALGVVTRLTLSVEPSYAVRQDVWVDAPVERVAEHLDEVLAAGYSVSVFSGLSRPDVVDAIWVKSRAGVDLVDGTAWGATPAAGAVHPIAGVDPTTATEQLGVEGRWHERLPHFRMAFTPSNGDEQQTEYLVPREHGAAALRAVAALDLKAALQVFELRSVAADDLWLSQCHGRDTVALHFTWVNDDLRVGRAVAALEAALDAFDPRPHWGKVFAMDAKRVREHYPKLPQFAQLAAKHDPNRKFGNDFLETYVY
jgi:alditol oxidase